MYDRPVFMFYTISYIWICYQCKIVSVKLTGLQNVCSRLKHFSVVAFTSQDKQFPSGPRSLAVAGEMNGPVCSCFPFLQPGSAAHLTLCSTAAVKDSRSLPPHLPGLWKATFGGLWNAQASGQARGSTQEEAQTVEPKADRQAATVVRGPPLPLSAWVRWTEQDVCTHLSTHGGRAMRGQPTGARGQCSRSMGLNMDLRNVTRKSSVVPPKLG